MKETEHPTPEAALIEAFRDIENDLAHPVEITDEEGNLIYSDQQIGELFVQSNHAPLPPPTIRARVIHKPTPKPDLLDWIVSKLHGKPRSWQ